MSKTWVIPDALKINGLEIELVNLELDGGIANESFEANATYKSKYSDGKFSISFNSEAQFNHLLTLAGAEVVQS